MKLRLNTLTLSLLFGVMTVAGCSAPEYHTPSVDTPGAYKETVDGVWKIGKPAEAQARGEWWKAFNDPALTNLIAEATKSNQSLAAAVARVKQARAIAGVTSADKSLQLGLTAGAQRLKDSPVSLRQPDDAHVSPTNDYQAKLSASYEVDLFGRVASNASAAEADASASAATYQSVLLALQADVAQTYYQLRALDSEIGLLKKNLNIRQENVQISQKRFDIGDIGELDLSRAKTELETLRADVYATEGSRSRLEHALALLLGKPAADFHDAVMPLDQDFTAPVIPAGVPSQLMERRPDIAASQEKIKAANARIGVARSAMFPVLQLTMTGGQESADLSNLLKSNVSSWGISSLLSLPILDGGRNKNNVARSEAVMEEAVAEYKQTVLTAFSEVEDNLVSLRSLNQQSDAINKALASSQRSAELADKLYQAGRSSYLDYLDAQRNQVNTERTSVQLKRQKIVSTIALIRSLGGAWR